MINPKYICNQQEYAIKVTTIEQAEEVIKAMNKYHGTNDGVSPGLKSEIQSTGYSEITTFVAGRMIWGYSAGLDGLIKVDYKAIKIEPIKKTVTDKVGLTDKNQQDTQE